MLMHMMNDVDSKSLVVNVVDRDEILLRSDKYSLTLVPCK